LGVFELVVHEKFTVETLPKKQTSLIRDNLFSPCLLLLGVDVENGHDEAKVMRHIFKSNVANLHIFREFDQMKVHLVGFDEAISASEHSFLNAIDVELLDNRVKRMQ
jgi:hypothetical protein